MMEVFDFDQCSPEWYACRAGIPTGSKFATVMAKGEGKTRSKYMRQLAGEILTGEPMENFSNGHMDRGKAMEEEARQFYCFMTDAECQHVGFIRNGQKGCSPDSLIGDEGGLEIKTALPDILIEHLLKNDMPSEHRAQCQGFLWVAERAWVDLIIYWPKMPLFRHRCVRDNGYIANLSGEVDRFNDELAALVEKLRGLT